MNSKGGEGKETGAERESDIVGNSESVEVEERRIDESPTPQNPQGWSDLSEEDIEGLAKGETQAVAAAFSGPVPPPRILEAYGEVVPNGAERIMSMAEREQDHRHEIERGYLGLAKSGQWFGALIGISALVCGTYLTATGHSIMGLVALVSVAGSVVGYLVLNAYESSGGEQEETDDDRDQTTDAR